MNASLQQAQIDRLLLSLLSLVVPSYLLFPPFFFFFFSLFLCCACDFLRKVGRQSVPLVMSGRRVQLAEDAVNASAETLLSEQIRAQKDKTLRNGTRGTIFWAKPNEKFAQALHDNVEPQSPQYKGSGTYTGEWKDNKQSGFGVATFANGRKYEGQWLNGKMHGTGTMWVKKSNGGGAYRKRYQGDFARNKFHGVGKMFYDSGDKYEGNFENHRRHGRGVCEYANGDVYEGEWRNDKRAGRGLLLLKNGDRFDGNFADDEKSGPGVYYYFSTRKMYEGEWLAGVPKCGEYKSLPAHFHDQVRPQKELRLPALKLRDPEQVLQNAKQSVREARDESLSAELTPAETFSADELEQLFTAFKWGDQSGTGKISPERFQLVVQHLGLNATTAQLQELCQELGVGPFDTIDRDRFLQLMCYMKAS